MGSTLDLGRRIELVSMDPQCRDITIGLYQPAANGGVPEYLIHSYSGFEGARQRLDFLVHAMQIYGGLDLTDGRLRFPCGVGHQLAIRRVFLEACKLATGVSVEPKPLSVMDKKLGRPVTVTRLDPGVYEVSVEGSPDGATRLEAITGGLRKLAEIEFVAGQPHRVRFACGQPHDALIGLLLPRALNVRAILREEEDAASRGMLVAPSAQK